MVLFRNVIKHASNDIISEHSICLERTERQSDGILIAVYYGNIARHTRTQRLTVDRSDNFCPV